MRALNCAEGPYEKTPDSEELGALFSNQALTEVRDQNHARQLF